MIILVEYFLDTSVIIGYASYFNGEYLEPFGKECELLLEDESYYKITSKNVDREMHSVKRRRIQLYRKIIQAIIENKDLNELEVDSKLQDHFKALISLIERSKIEKTVESFRTIEQLFSRRLIRARHQLIKEIINADAEFERKYPGMGYNKTSWEDLLRAIIDNIGDSKVIMDCVVLSDIRGKLILVTLDWKHILSKKDKIKKFIEENCLILPSFNPDFELCHVKDVVSK